VQKFHLCGFGEKGWLIEVSLNWNDTIEEASAESPQEILGWIFVMVGILVLSEGQQNIDKP